jgi:hypothetical protein
MSIYDEFIKQRVSKGWELDLYHKYPKLFRQKDLSASETCMCWGIACGAGWKDLIGDACEKLQKFADENGITIEFAQVKEKYGGLRLYIDVDYPEGHKFKDVVVQDAEESLKEEINQLWRDIYTIVGEAEKKSYRTCEVCGNTGETRSGGWVRTLCDEHANEKGSL